MKKEKEKEKKKKREKQSVNSRASEEPAAEPPFSESSLPEHTDDLSGGMNDLRQALEELGGKWRLQVLWSLRSGGELRYGTIKSAIPGITDMMLSQSLRAALPVRAGRASTVSGNSSTGGIPYSPRGNHLDSGHSVVD